ncbi:MAG: nitroreductase [Sphingomicrobium sp.]
MLNDRSSALSLLETRRSGRPRDLVGPGPTPTEMQQILTIAARTPDHGELCPWRFVTVASGQREALAALLSEALAAEQADAPEAKRDKAAQFAHYAGQLVVLVSAPVADHKIPRSEQLLSVGAAGMNLLLAAHALGYAGGWVTGWYAYSDEVRAAFCDQGEHIAGFIFIGQPSRELEERSRPPLSAVCRAWDPSRNRPSH